MKKAASVILPLFLSVLLSCPSWALSPKDIIGKWAEIRDIDKVMEIYKDNHVDFPLPVLNEIVTGKWKIVDDDNIRFEVPRLGSITIYRGIMQANRILVVEGQEGKIFFMYVPESDAKADNQFNMIAAAINKLQKEEEKGKANSSLGAEINLTNELNIAWQTAQKTKQGYANVLGLLSKAKAAKEPLTIITTYYTEIALLTQAEDAKYRDGKKALKMLADHQYALRKFGGDVLFNSMVGLAHAENGNFKDAIEEQEFAIEIARREGYHPQNQTNPGYSPKMIANFQKAVLAYKSKKICRSCFIYEE